MQPLNAALAIGCGYVGLCAHRSLQMFTFCLPGFQTGTRREGEKVFRCSRSHSDRLRVAAHIHQGFRERACRPAAQWPGHVMVRFPVCLTAISKRLALAQVRSAFTILGPRSNAAAPRPRLGSATSEPWLRLQQVKLARNRRNRGTTTLACASRFARPSLAPIKMPCSRLSPHFAQLPGCRMSCGQRSLRRQPH